jgi:hypothetical protein
MRKWKIKMVDVMEETKGGETISSKDMEASGEDIFGAEKRRKI